MTITGGDIGREEAHELARRELEKNEYHGEAPSFFTRALDKIGDLLDRLFRGEDPSSGLGSGMGWMGWAALIVLVAILVTVIAAIVWRLGGVRRGAGRRAVLDDTKPSTAKEHRSAAEEFAARGEWAQAIRERLRAIARDLEERAILDPRPGRTADELATEAGQALPSLIDELRAGVRVFDDVWYGGRTGSREGYELLSRLEERVRSAKPQPIETAGSLA